MLLAKVESLRHKRNHAVGESEPFIHPNVSVAAMFQSVNRNANSNPEPYCGFNAKKAVGMVGLMVTFTGLLVIG
jgi:hypothetical protein